MSRVPLTQGMIPRKVPLFTMPWAGSITYDGKLYAIGYPITAIDTMGYFNVWDDPFNLAMYRNIPLVDQGKIFGTALDEKNEMIYVGPYFNSAPRRARVWQWNIVTEQLSVLVNDVALGIGSPQTGTQSGLCTDGTYIYFVYYTQISTASWIFKARISDGTIVASLQMPTSLTFGGTAFGASRIEMYDANTLAVMGLGNGWVATVPTDLSGVTHIAQPDSGATLFGLQVIEGRIWVGSYVGTRVYVFSDATLSSVTTYDFTAAVGSGQPVFEMRWDGGEYIWLTFQNYIVAGVNIDTGDPELVLRELAPLAPTPLGSSGWSLGVIWPLPQGIALTDEIAAADRATNGYFIQYGTAPSQPPLLGRGVSGRR